MNRPLFSPKRSPAAPKIAWTRSPPRGGCLQKSWCRQFCLLVFLVAQTRAQTEKDPAIAGPMPGSVQLEGRVTAMGGEPMGGAAVRLYQHGKALRTTSTDASGDFALESLAGSYDLHASKDQVSAWRIGLSLGSGNEERLDLQLGPASRISGSVLALDGSALVNVVAQVVKASTNVSPPLSLSAEPSQHLEVAGTSMTDASGKFLFPDLPPGQYQVRIHTPGRLVYFAGGAALDLGNWAKHPGR